MTKVINFGSINIDHIYRVPHFVSPGETLASHQLRTVLGGKGANQSVALARAGVSVSHVGQLNDADQWAIDELAAAGVNTDLIQMVETASGHAIIQVDAAGENAIILHGGANQSVSQSHLESCIASSSTAEFLLLQNECNLLEHAIGLGKKAGLRVVLNPAPMSEDITKLPLDELDLLIVNEVEAEALCGTRDSNDAIMALARLLPNTEIVLTLGSQGAIMKSGTTTVTQSAFAANIVDTTAAGDTFVGYFVAGLAEGLTNQENLQRACLAASITVETLGAIPSIPTLDQVQDRC